MPFDIFTSPSGWRIGEWMVERIKTGHFWAAVWLTLASLPLFALFLFLLIRTTQHM